MYAIKCGSNNDTVVCQTIIVVFIIIPYPARFDMMIVCYVCANMFILPHIVFARQSSIHIIIHEYLHNYILVCVVYIDTL